MTLVPTTNTLHYDRRYIKYARVIDGHICTRTKVGILSTWTVIIHLPFFDWHHMQVAGNLVDMLDQRWLLFRKAYYHKTVRMIEYR